MQHGSTPPIVQTVEPLIQNVVSPRSVTPSHQVETLPPMPMPIKSATFYQWESISNFDTTVLSQHFLLVKITQTMGERLTRVHKDVVDIK